MVHKIVALLLAAHAITALRLQGLPEQLQTIIQDLNQNIPPEIHEASIRIRANLVPLSYYTNKARQNVISSLTDEAQPYWTEINELQEQAEKTNKSVCIDEGMKHFYELNNTIIAEPNKIIDNYYREGNATLYKSYDEINGVSQELESLTSRANECAEDECANDLITEAIKFYSESIETINKAVDEINQYVQVDLEKNLANVHIDKDTYAANYTTILEEIKTCISS